MYVLIEIIDNDVLSVRPFKNYQSAYAAFDAVVEEQALAEIVFKNWIVTPSQHT